MEVFKTAIKMQVAAGNEMEAYGLTEHDIAEIQKLRDTKYATWEWNYGFSPEYTIRKEEKFDGGIVTAHMNVEKGRIKEIKLFGDFFGNGDIAELEETLQGLPLDEHLEDNLQRIHIDEYLSCIRRCEFFVNCLLNVHLTEALAEFPPIQQYPHCRRSRQRV